METAERQHAKKMEQIMASIDKKLERIAKSLEKMEPTVYKLPKFDLPLNDPDIEVPADDLQHPTRITVEDPAASGKDPASAEEKSSKTGIANYWRDCLSDAFKP